MPLYKERMRLKRLAEREAAGEYVFTKDFCAPARTKIKFAFQVAIEPAGTWVWQTVRDLLLEDEGKNCLVYDSVTDEYDVTTFLNRASDDEEVPMVIEAMDLACVRCNSQCDDEIDIDEFRKAVNRVLASYRISFELINGEMVPFESRELHQEIVAPMLRLLGGLEGWDGIENDYQKALREIAVDPGDAITDAGRALQTTLELLGCQGNKLGPLIASAKEKGLLAPHDTGLGEGVRKIMDWVSADRSNLGDTHTQAKPTPADAWLAVHVVGALILRLAGGPRA